MDLEEQYWEDSCRMELQVPHENEAFLKFVLLAKILGYQHVAVGLELPLSVADPWCAFFANYASDWEEKFLSRSPKHHGPRMAYGKRTAEPDMANPVYYWTRNDFTREAIVNDIKLDWNCTVQGRSGYSATVWLSGLETDWDPAIEVRTRALAELAAEAIASNIVSKNIPQCKITLAPLERSYLRWVLDGKTAGEIADIMNIGKTATDSMQRKLPDRFQRSGIFNTAFFAFRLGMLTESP